MTPTVVIPARYASTRFPGKPLALLGGREIILRVCDRVAQTGYRLAVATDDERIARCVTAAGYEAVMTRPDHRSGTDRVWEAYEAIASGQEADADRSVVVNVQGDEPFIEPANIVRLVEAFETPSTDIATLVTPFSAGLGYDALADPNLVKVELNAKGEAMTFSRSVVPYLRGIDKREWPSRHRYLTHIGVYAYRAGVLREITHMPPGVLEQAESLEQLRWLQAGFTIAAVEATSRTIGIDTPEDLRQAEEFLRHLNG